MRLETDIMIIKRSLSEQLVIEYLNIYYNIEITTLTPLLLGADMNASVYKLKDLIKNLIS